MSPLAGKHLDLRIAEQRRDCDKMLTRGMALAGRMRDLRSQHIKAENELRRLLLRRRRLAAKKEAVRVLQRLRAGTNTKGRDRR